MAWVSPAAKSLQVTQPTLSRQLAALEDELGHLLYQRNRKGMKRRDFLKASAAAAAATAAAGLAGCAPSTATDMAETGGNTGATTHQVASDAAIIEGKGEWMPIH